ncbi:hypothetical protein NQ317_008046 [Molorchus minor]|uniref:Uncharacterized protein n=1 Tax=Molorchus minor TaxID=1323400 RepID=A0ABQ9JQR5_9CUCU|nr:hypothetical protein NQ317_008046 [Molorchus minor]
MLQPTFTLELNYKIVPGLVTLGKYDGTHPSITAATSTDKVLIHSPHKKNVSTSGRMIWSETNREIATLNINHSITCLATGILNPKDGKDVLVIGINTHILVYNVHDNKDIFYKECQDGAKSLAIGTFNGSELPLVMVGGNSSVHGFDTSGREIFWTAFGEVITSLVLMDFTKSGLNELIVASEDFNIRIFKGNQVLATLVETEMVTNLIPLPEHRLAYSVSNGTVGAYEQEKRLWRIKSKNVANALHPYDLVGQSKVQLVTGWSHGKIDCRSVETGEVYFKESMNSCVAGIVEGDYRSTGRADVICVSCEGEVELGVKTEHKRSSSRIFDSKAFKGRIS